MAIHSYSSIYNLGHKALEDLFDGAVLIEEKIDGSQISFRKDKDGNYEIRSKGKDQTPPITDKMFELVVEKTKNLPLYKEWIYRSELLNKCKHNSLIYSRIPHNNIVIFDIDIGLENYLSWEEKKKESERLGFEVAPVLFEGKIASWEELKPLLDTDSFLGGTKIEGIVIKNYARFGVDKKTLMGKFVSEAFKEVHSREWKKANPQTKDIVSMFIDAFRTEARWQKAIQHLKEQGQDITVVQAIGPLLKEINQDVLKEEEDNIKDALFKWAWPRISRGMVAGVPQWFKEKIAEEGFLNEAPKIYS